MVYHFRLAQLSPVTDAIYSGDMPIDESKLKEIQKVVEEAGVALNATSGSEGIGSWEGGVVWLVPTDKSIAEWKPIATRTL